MTSLMVPARRHWWTALCSLSTGSSSRRLLRAAAITSSPAATRTSLLERATLLAALDGLVGGFESDDADGGGDHDVGVEDEWRRRACLRGHGGLRAEAIPFSRRRRESSSASCGVATETSSGWWRSIWGRVHRDWSRRRGRRLGIGRGEIRRRREFGDRWSRWNRGWRAISWRSFQLSVISSKKDKALKSRYEKRKLKFG